MPDSPEIEYQTEYRSFPIKLTDLEIAGLGRKMAKTCALSEDAEAKRLQLVSDATEMRKHKKGLDAEIVQVARIVSAGEEPRRTKCEWRPHRTQELMLLYRLDVPDSASEKERIVDSRPMTPAEKRGEFTTRPTKAKKNGAVPADAPQAPAAPATDATAAPKTASGANQPLPTVSISVKGEGYFATLCDLADGTALVAECAAFPDLSGEGATQADALASLTVAIEKHLEAGGKATNGTAKGSAGPVACPFIRVEYGPDPRKDQLCGAEGSRRSGGFCPDHRDLSGQQRIHITQRRKERQRLQHQAAKQATGKERQTDFDGDMNAPSVDGQPAAG